MNTRLLHYTIGMAVLPLGGALLLFGLRESAGAMLLVVLLTSVLQIPVILVSRAAMRVLIMPDFRALREIGVEYVPAAYEPGRFRVDARVCDAAMWVTALVPFFTWMAIRCPSEVVVPVLNFATYTAPSGNWMLLALLALCVGVAAYPSWMELSRAAVMYAEGSEQKRYLIRGFEDWLEQSGGLQAYLKACRSH